MRVLAAHSICQFPLHFPSRASPFVTRFRTNSSYASIKTVRRDVTPELPPSGEAAISTASKVTATEAWPALRLCVTRSVMKDLLSKLINKMFLNKIMWTAMI